MDHMNSAGQSAVQERSTGELVKEMAEQVSVLVRDELKLAQLEMKSKGKRAGSGIGMMGGGGLIALYGVGCLIACAIIAISHAVTEWLAALIVGVALLAVAAMVALAGKGRMSKATPPMPEEAVGSIKTDVEEIRERARR
jgi:uncharacterized membrane protein YqjE